MIIEMPLTLILLANGGYGEECSYVNTFEIWEVGNTIYARGKVDEGEGNGYPGVRNSFLNDWEHGGEYDGVKYPGVAAYFRATGRTPPQLTEDYIKLSLSRIKGNWDNYGDVKECSAKYIFALCKDWKTKNVESPAVKQDTMVLPPVVLQDTLKGPDIIVQDTLKGPDIVIQDSIVIPDTVIVKPETEKGLFRLDEINGSKIGYKIFHRNRHGPDFLGLGPCMDVRTGGKDLRGKLGLELIALDYDNDDQKVLAKGDLGIYNRNIGGGFKITHDVNENTFVYPYMKGAINLGDVVINGKGGAGFDQDFNIRQFLEGALNYASANDKFRIQLYGKNEVDPLKENDQYYNTAGVNLAFGDKAKLLLGLEGKTNYGSDIWPNKTAEEVAKSIELKYSVGGEFKPSENVSFFVLGYAKGQHNDQEHKYKNVEFGGKTGIKFYIPGPSKRPEPKKKYVGDISVFDEIEEPVEEPVLEGPMTEEPIQEEGE